MSEFNKNSTFGAAPDCFMADGIPVHFKSKTNVCDSLPLQLKLYSMLTTVSNKENRKEKHECLTTK